MRSPRKVSPSPSTRYAIISLSIASHAGALAAPTRRISPQSSRRLPAHRDRIGTTRANGSKPLASATNFVTIDCGCDGVYAKRVLDGLIAQGIFVRMPGVALLNRCIRVSAGTEADLAAFAETLPTARRRGVRATRRGARRVHNCGHAHG